METISLNRQQWNIDPTEQLGKAGGFGEVFKGQDLDGSPVAIKRLKLTAGQAAHREMNIGADLIDKKLSNVVPILDSGLDANSDRYYLVMPICAGSLQDRIDDSHVPIEANEAIQILHEILKGLEEVAHVTHRDLKPSNILNHDGRWKLADFGIAKFVEDSTSLESLRTSLTPAYAAPEQWLLERPTAATDIYALGCIAHALMTGSPPFKGDMDMLRENHLNDTPPPLTSLPPSVKSIVQMMLRKSSDIRPSRKRCLDVVESARSSVATSDGVQKAKLQEAVSLVANAQALEEAKTLAEQERVSRRNKVFHEATNDLKRIKQRIYRFIYDHGKDVMDAKKFNINGPEISLEKARLKFDTSEGRSGGIRKSDPYGYAGCEGNWGVHKRKSRWDIVAFTTISIATGGYTRSANLIFARPNNESEYRWYELSFWSLGTAKNKTEPYALNYVWEVDETLSAMHIHQPAHKPTVIDGENEDSFINYWIDLFSQAATGNLGPPNQMPIQR